MKPRKTAFNCTGINANTDIILSTSFLPRLPKNITDWICLEIVDYQEASVCPNKLTLIHYLTVGD